MNTTVHKAHESVAYFAGYARGEAHDGRAHARRIVEAYLAAFFARKVAKDTFRAFADGWRRAEAVKGVR